MTLFDPHGNQKTLGTLKYAACHSKTKNTAVFSKDTTRENAKRKKAGNREKAVGTQLRGYKGHPSPEMKEGSQQKSKVKHARKKEWTKGAPVRNRRKRRRKGKNVSVEREVEARSSRSVS